MKADAVSPGAAVLGVTRDRVSEQGQALAKPVPAFSPDADFEPGEQKNRRISSSVVSESLGIRAICITQCHPEETARGDKPRPFAKDERARILGHQIGTDELQPDIRRWRPLANSKRLKRRPPAVERISWGSDEE